MWRRRIFSSLRYFSSESETPSPPSLYSFLQPSIFAVRKPHSIQSPNLHNQTPKPTTLDEQQNPNLESALRLSLHDNSTDEAWKCFKSFSSSKLLPSKPLINSLITHLCGVKDDSLNLKRAFATLMFVLETNPDLLEHKTIETFLNSVKITTNGTPAFALVKCMFKNRHFVPFGMWGDTLVEISRKRGRFCDFFEVFNENCRVAKEEKMDSLRPNLAACNAALEGCCHELESVTDAQKVLDTMSLLGVHPDETSFGSLAYLYAIKGLDKKIPELEDLVCRFGFVDKTVFVSKLVSGYVRSGNLESVSTTILHNLRALDGKGLSFQVTYGEIVKGYLEHGSIKGLASLILEAQKLESTTVLVEKSVGFGIINACVNIGLLEKAHSILDEMNAQGGSVGLGVYVSILKAYGKEQRTAEAAQLVSEMSGLGLELDVSSFDALIDVSMSCQDFQSAFSLFRDMREARIPELMGSYLTIMTGLTENHRPELMAVFLDEVVEDPRVKIGTHDWNSIIHAFCKAGRLEDARRTFRRMVFLQFEPTEQTYLSLVNGYMNAGNYFNVLMMWNDVKKRASFNGEKSFKLDRGLVDAFLYALVKGGFFDAVMQVVEKSQEMKIFVDKWRYKQAFMENHKKLKVSKLRKRSIKKMEALVAFKNWAGLNT